MKQEKLCEAEDMMPKDYSRYYVDPVEQQKFNEDMGADNARYMWAELEKRTKAFHDERNKTVCTHEEPKSDSYQIGGTHYLDMAIQPWDVIDQGPKEQRIGFYRYNALKYVMRAGEKGEFKEDIAKAQHYLEKLLEIL